MSNITLNIVEPGSSTPIDPVVPNTGLFTHGIGGPEATILGITAAVIILAVIVAVLYYRKKQGKFISISHSKATTIGLTTLALLVSIGTVAGLLKLGASAVDDGLNVTTSSTDFTIEVGDEPVFAALPVELTVAEATEAGYTLTAYTENTNLVSTTDSSKVIPMVTVDEGELAVLANNTYGLALVEPENKDSEVYTALSTVADVPTFITDKDYEATAENDTTTIYYGFYITPDVPYGTYTGSDIKYVAEPNYITNLSFNGNGSDGGTAIEGMTIIAGDTITLPPNTYTREGYTFTGWNTQADGEGTAYVDEAEFTASLTQSEDITLYAQWEQLCPVNSICYKANGADGTTTMSNQTTDDNGDPLATGSNVTLWASNYSYVGHGFVGWSADANAWEHLNDEGSTSPIIYGPNQTITTSDLSVEGIKLYAVWAPAETNDGNTVYLQDWTGCSSLTATTYDDGTLVVGKNTITALTDSRDGNVYAVARLSDGNCWTVENLRLDSNAIISTANTNNPLTVDGNVSIKNNNGGTSNRLSPTSSGWCTNRDSECFDQSYLYTGNTQNTISEMTDADANIYSYGNYYNAYSATAGKGTYNIGQQGTTNLDGDICPSGWKMPIRGESQSSEGSWLGLNISLGGGSGWGDSTLSNNWRSFPNNFIYSGYWDENRDLASARGQYGDSWSSTATNVYSGQKVGMYKLYFADSFVYLGDISYGSGGLTVRCLTLGQ